MLVGKVVFDGLMCKQVFSCFIWCEVVWIVLDVGYVEIIVQCFLILCIWILWEMCSCGWYKLVIVLLMNDVGGIYVVVYLVFVLVCQQYIKVVLMDMDLGCFNVVCELGVLGCEFVVEVLCLGQLLVDLLSMVEEVLNLFVLVLEQLEYDVVEFLQDEVYVVELVKLGDFESNMIIIMDNVLLFSEDVVLVVILLVDVILLVVDGCNGMVVYMMQVECLLNGMLLVMGVVLNKFED